MNVVKCDLSPASLSRLCWTHSVVSRHAPDIKRRLLKIHLTSAAFKDIPDDSWNIRRTRHVRARARVRAHGWNGERKAIKCSDSSAFSGRVNFSMFAPIPKDFTSIKCLKIFFLKKERNCTNTHTSKLTFCLIFQLDGTREEEESARWTSSASLEDQ